MADGRFAPSPTGDLHLGNLRTALLAWLFARSAGSRFSIRMEDLDTATVRAGVASRQLDDLRALGLDWDGAVVHQSERLARYEDAIGQLTRAGWTYPCYCTRREILEAASAPHGPAPDGAYPGTCRDLSRAERSGREAAGRPPALRLRSGDELVSFVDRQVGRYTGLVDDVVIRRNDGTPAYNLAVVVDDVAQGIAEVVRGDDLLSSTPRQIFVARALGLTPPAYAHVPLVLAPDGSRLAKRHGSVTLADRAERGQEPASILGELAASLSLVEPHRTLGPHDLRALARDFDPARLPTTPWIVPADRL